MSFVLTVQASGSTRMPPVPGNQMGTRTLGVQGEADTPHLCCTLERYAFAFHLSAENRHDAPEGRKLIGGICPGDSHPF